MLNLVIPVALAMMTVAMALNLWRVVRGPDLPDRIIGLDTLYVNTIALLVLFGIGESNAVYFEAALLIAMMGFVGTVALCKYLLRGDVIE
ncbi:MAG: K+/H+ antiporter subunit F [Chromatiales bacterium]|jgi:multicomponent K+:H+ antiporter subunit F|nr:K+/H+ antiporter subunit F [Chromatiales bacterium]MDX9768128.1 K+/H+ antiporter subunit F [Ectothiorhodospiraceae bacterium]